MINEVNEDDISKLNDADLRELIGKLCENTLDRYNIDSIGVTYGGKQDESDGGVDVRIKSSAIFDDAWAVPRNNTIFQVKKPKMTPSEIEKEMKKKDGKISKSIKELVNLRGAYIIVSSGANLTDKTLKSRLDKMNEIMSTIDKEKNVKLDFYDSKRIATWVNQFPNMIIWVNEKVNNKTIGWTTYGNWSNPNEEEKDFIIDENIFLHKDNFDDNNKRTVIEGINEIRYLLSTDRKVVRLAGLSGVGKTRFAQALFDKNLGENPLNKNEVIYCDIGNNPNPVPITFIQELLITSKRVILIVDNCDKELHNDLAKFAIDSKSKISLMTIEYDVKENTDIESCNYYLDTSSDNTIRKLLKRDFNYIQDGNIETIVKCSNGNFRIARYLAKTIDRNESVGILKEQTLFERLFYQNNEKNDELLSIGKVTSICLSFNNVYNDEDPNNELKILGNLIGKNSLVIYRNVSELNKRQIIQKRGNMRALLPHAIANRLADDLLNSLPIEFIINEIQKSNRLELSVFRRLKFLHDKEYSIKIAEIYMSKYDFEKCNEMEMEILQCIKVISPEKLLYKIEQIDNEHFFSRDNEKFYEWVRILSYIAYDRKYFNRSVILLIKFAKTEKVGENCNSVRDVVYKLFHIMLSGTHATINERIEIVNILINSSCDIENQLALKLLDELLETGGFIVQIVNDDTSRKRDYGYMPKTKEEYYSWYREILNYCESLILNNKFKTEIKEIIANNFRNLASCGLYNELENLVNKILKKETWPQIWISIGVVKHFDKSEVPEEMLIRMNELQEKCVPQKIEDKIIVYLNKKKRIFYEFDDISENDKMINKTIEELGIEIAEDMQKLKINLLLIDDSCSRYRIWALMKGLYTKIGYNEEFIFFMLENIKENNTEIFLEMIFSYIALIEDKNKVNSILDKILLNKKYNKYYPKIQFGYKLKDNDIDRIIKSLEMKVANIRDYSRMEYALSDVNIEKIIRVLKVFPKSRDAEDVIINILQKLYLDKRKCKKLDVFSRNFIASIDWENRNNWNDILNYELGQIIGICFSKKTGKQQAKKIFNNFVNIINKNFFSFYEYQYILIPLINLYPIEFLDNIFRINEKYKIKHFVNGFTSNANILNSIDNNLMIEWMEKNKKVKELSYVINPIEIDENFYRWNKISKYIFEKYVDNNEVIENLLKGIYPNSWSDKYSSVLKRRLSLAKELEENENNKIKNIGKILREKLNREINIMENEEKKEQDRYNTFE